MVNAIYLQFFDPLMAGVCRSKEETLPQEMGEVESRFTEASLKMRISRLSIRNQVILAWQMLAQTPMDHRLISCSLLIRFFLLTVFAVFLDHYDDGMVGW
uniref:Uncharacterized protein n=1 Tax=Spongospora subterranea TaxID=70186 RepID=A0A0H5QT87_9EUKA|eukprot:CRZ04932.1 hypothetical protein [Spongospora subterranea]